MTSDELFPERIGAIMRSIELGRTLQRDHPEIAELYKQGHTLPMIAEKLEIKSNYQIIGDNVSVKGVNFAITGHVGGFGIDPYEGLIAEDERRELDVKHKQNGGRGTYERRVGVHGQTLEQRSQVGLKWGATGGRISGRTTHENRIGVHSLTSEEKRQIGLKNYRERKGIHKLTSEEKKEIGQKVAIGRGQVPWSDEEKQFAYELSQHPYFMKGSLVRNVRIAQALNGVYHNGQEIRMGTTVQLALHKYRKSLGANTQLD